MDRKIARMIDVHHQLWEQVARTKCKTYRYSWIGRSTKIQTQNLSKNSWNTKQCTSKGWRISWIFYKGKYFGKIIEVPGKGIDVYKLKAFTNTGADELIYSA